VLQQSLDTSKELDGMLLKAYGLAKLGDDMASSDPEGAMENLEEAFTIARQALTPKYRNAYTSLSGEVADWPAADKEQVAGAIDNIDLASSRVWLIRYIAEAMYPVNPDRAGEVASWAVNQTGGITNDMYRDLDLRGLSAYFADKDIVSANNVAMRISDLKVKSFAFKQIAGQAIADGNITQAKLALDKAAGFAKSMPSMDAPVPEKMYADSAPDEVKAQVQAHENAKQTAYAARALSSIAVMAKAIDTRVARAMLDDAVSMAESIDEEYSYTKAYALSDIAANYAVVDTNAAESILGKLDSEHAGAKASGIVKIAKVKANYNVAGIVSDITPLTHLVEEMEEPYEGAMALYSVGSIIAPASPEKARELSAEIEYPEIKNALLIEVAKVWAEDNVEEAKLVIEDKPKEGGHGEEADSFFHIYQYSPAGTLYQKAVAYMAMADAVSQSDPESAMKLYAKAAGFAADSGSSQLEWSLATKMCKIDHSKFMGYAAKLAPTDAKSQVKALVDIATDWSMKGDPYSGLVWDEAIGVAGSTMDDFEAGCLLGKVGSACSGYYPDKASGAFMKSAERYAKVGAE